MTYRLPSDRNARARFRYRLAHPEPRRPGRPRNADTSAERDKVERKAMFTGRLPISIIARMQRLKDEGIATGAYPWRTMTAVHEALILRGFESMAGDPFIDEMLPYLRATAQIDGMAAHRREAQAALVRVQIEIQELMKIGAVDQAVQYFHAIYDDFENMSPNVWRDWAIEKMRKAFPQLHKVKPKGIPIGATPTTSDERYTANAGVAPEGASHDPRPRQGPRVGSLRGPRPVRAARRPR